MDWAGVVELFSQCCALGSVGVGPLGLGLSALLVLRFRIKCSPWDLVHLVYE